ncbi:MAG TPA: glycosyltransferase family 39 protein [Solirubrobacteraceae bacterium]|nr:glycosyltransferase family 39 protein [Solirubrobacteraceae bacterium]
MRPYVSLSSTDILARVLKRLTLDRATLSVALITLFGAALRFYRIGHQGFWYDEAYTVFLIKYPAKEMLQQIPHFESTPPLYYCVAWVWARIFGFGQAGIRSLSALCGTLTIPVAYAAARKVLAGRPAALIAAALTACNPLLIWYSQEARAYSMMVLFSACTLLTFAYARERPRPLALALWAASCVLALATHYYAILVIAPEALWMLYEHRYKRAVYGALGFIAVIGAALLPLLLEQSGSGRDAWIGRSALGKRLSQLIPISLIGPQTPARVELKYLAYVLVLAAFALLLWRSRRRERQAVVLPLVIGFSGFLIALLLVPVNDSLLGRNLLALWLPLAMVVAAGLGVLRARVLGFALAAALCGIGITATIGVAQDYWLERPHWQSVAQVAGPLTPGANRIVIVLHNSGAEPLALYMPGLTYLKHVSLAGIAPDVDQIDIVAVEDKRGLGGFCWWGSACNLSPGHLPHRHAIPGFHFVGRYHVKQFWVLKLASNRPVTVTQDQIVQGLLPTRLNDSALLIQT